MLSVCIHLQRTILHALLGSSILYLWLQAQFYISRSNVLQASVY